MIKVKISKIKIYWKTFLMIFFMWVLYGFNTYNSDYINYENRFYYGKFGGYESGLRIIMNISRQLGTITYQGFILELSLILLLIVFIVVIKYSGHPQRVLFLFCLYPFAIFIIGVKFAISFTIMLVGFAVLLNDIRYKKIIYLVLVLLASLFHISSLIYLIFLFYRIPLRQRDKLVAILFIDFILALLTYTPMFYYLVHIFTDGTPKITDWFTRHARFGMIIPISQQLFSFAIFRYAYRLSRKKSLITKLDGRTLYDINILALVLIPFYFINGSFVRLYKVFTLINTIFYSEIIYSTSIGKHRFSILGILNFMEILYFTIYEILLRPMVWIPIFENNLIFDYLKILISNF